MFKELEVFFDKLFKFDDMSITHRQKPPLTCEAYGIALQEELFKIKRKFVEFEIDLMKQGIFFLN